MGKETVIMIDIEVSDRETYPTEKDLQRACMDYVKKLEKAGHPIMCMNIGASAYNRSGRSDLILCINGRFVAIELKNGRNNSYKPTPLQLKFISVVEQCNGMGVVIYTIKEFKEYVDAILEM